MNILLLGGDERTILLAAFLKEDNFNVMVYGINDDKGKQISDILFHGSLEEALSKADYVIGPTPFSRDNKTVNAPLFSGKIYFDDIIKNIKDKAVLLGTKIPLELRSRLNFTCIKVYDFMEDEELNIMNSIPTAEGAIAFAINNTAFTINESNMLVMGYGRIGKILAKILKGMNANVYVEARKISDLAWIRAMGYIPVDLKDLDSSLEKYDIIFNTIPAMIFDKKRLKLLKKNCLIVDVSTNPGGVDFEAAKILGIKADLVLGIPGKVAPHTAAKYIEQAFLSVMRR